MFKQSERELLENLVERLVRLEGLSGTEGLDHKIQFLCFVSEQLKFERGGDNDEISFEEYMQSTVSIWDNQLIISAPPLFQNVGSGTSPIQLQAPLLLFLLLNHKERYQVLDIIRLFVEQMRGELTFLDFKKTKTGVTRCFTNTRFAAHVLRDYGLLKFTNQQAFKTWELSLAGFLVAASILQQRASQKRPWYDLGPARDGSFDLLSEIRDACRGITSYDEFVVRLAAICEPDAALFKSFQPALKEAYALLQGYWAILSDQSKTHKERREASLERIKRLDSLGEEFFRELSRCVQINDALRRIMQSAK
ncbi:MAG: hypothetical protein P0111_03910 [Nitrospira sp.]|nr:hypothetical protein [Nitrospira sp.]